MLLKFHLLSKFRQSFYFLLFKICFLINNFMYLICDYIIVKMMKTLIHSLGGRSASNSQQSNKMKKSLSSAFSNKIKSQENPSINTMMYSIKKARENNSNSKSNKKSNNQSCHSNKIFKALAEITPSTNIQSSKKSSSKKNEIIAASNDKKTTTAISVKNIKQKIIGKGANDSIIQHNKILIKDSVQKENDGQMHKNKKEINIPGRKDTENNEEEILLNFSCVLQSFKSEQLSLSMFQVGRKLGRGKFGDVYMCRDIRTGFVCAIKMISKLEVKAAEMESQLIQQIKIQLYSNHPNILKMYGFFHDSNKIYLLLELATNACLFKEIRKKNYFQQNLASFYFRQVVNGVRYLHSNSIIHRDIKPQNILNSFNVLKICDFGWAIYSPLYKRQTFCGTLDYVPPQIVTGDFYDEKADVWCLGVLCYQLSTGKAPFESQTDENQTYNKILKVQIQFPKYLSPNIIDFIGKILNRDPSKRMSLQDVQRHDWMKKYENQVGRMISKDIWDIWIKLLKGQ